MEYICEECGYIFDEPHEYYEGHGLDYPPYEKWSVCPNCGSPSYKELTYDEENEEEEF